MSHKIFCFLASVVFTFLSCGQDLKNTEDWLNKNTVELKTENGYDFSAIGKAIGDKRVIALGESSHGLGEFYALKAALVKYLHEEKGFEVLAIEGGLGDVNLAYSNIDTLTQNQLRDATVFGNFRAKEADTLFKYILSSYHKNSPLLYTGFDTQLSSDYFSMSLKKYLKAIDSNFVKNIEAEMESYYKMVQFARAQDSVGYYKHQRKFQKVTQKALNLFIQNENLIDQEFGLSEFQKQIIIRTLKLLYRAIDLPYRTWWKGSEVRDQLMAENLDWLMSDIFKDKKIIIWAHNAHIENTGLVNRNMKWMGHYLKETLENDYYSLGLFAYEGKTYKHWTRTYENFKHKDSSFIEHKLVSTGKEIVYLNLCSKEPNTFNHWIYEEINAFEVENGGQVSFIPHKRFDGIITVKYSDAPTYGN